MEITKEDLLSLRLEIAELRREIAELRRELTVKAEPPVGNDGYEADAEQSDVSTEQIMTEWTEGEEAWQRMSK